MNKNQPWFVTVFTTCVFAMALLMYAGSFRLLAEQPAAPDGAAQVSSAAVASPCEPSKLGSPYIPVDSWVYPAMLRLYSLGYVDTVYIGLRPWTRASLMHMLENAGNLIEEAEDQSDPGANEARQIYVALNHELHYDMEGPCGLRCV